jgi:hypothetical protein
MPKVPTLTPSAAPTTSGNVNIPTRAFGQTNRPLPDPYAQVATNIGQGLVSIGTDIRRKNTLEEETLAQKAERENNETVVRDSMNRYRARSRENTAGYLSTKSKRGSDIVVPATEWHEEQRRGLSEEFENDDQRFLFNRQADAVMNNHLTTLARHQAGQKEAWRIESLVADRTNAISDGIMAARNGEKAGILASELEVKNSTIEINEGPEAISDGKITKGTQLKVDLAVSSYYKDMVKDILVDDYNRANVIYEDRLKAGKITINDQNYLEPLLEVSRINEQSESYKNYIMSDRSIDKTRDGVEFALEKIKDEDVRKKTRQKVYAAITDQQNAYKKQISQSELQTQDAIDVVINSENPNEADALAVLDDHEVTYGVYPGSATYIRKMRGYIGRVFKPKDPDKVSNDWKLITEVRRRINLPRGSEDRITSTNEVLVLLTGKAKDAEIEETLKQVQGGGIWKQVNYADLESLFTQLSNKEPEDEPALFNLVLTKLSEQVTTEEDIKKISLRERMSKLLATGYEEKPDSNLFDRFITGVRRTLTSDDPVVVLLNKGVDPKLIRTELTDIQKDSIIRRLERANETQKALGLPTYPITEESVQQIWWYDNIKKLSGR